MMDVAKEFIKRSPGQVLMVLSVGSIVLGAIYLLGGVMNNMQSQLITQGSNLGILQQKVNDLEHKIDLLEKDIRTCEVKLEECRARLVIREK